jgi:ABC-type Fe3+-hydroxamate transport system substrate-binding protein
MKKGLFALNAVALLAFFAGCASTNSVAPENKTTVAAPQAQAATAPQVEPVAAPQAIRSAAGNTVTLWNFESKTTDGWAGTGQWSQAVTVNDDPNFVKQGKYSLKINAKGSNGWNQDIAVNEGPFPSEFSKLKTITMDVFVPKETIAGLQYAQLFIVISSSANSWYQVPQDLKEGWNSLEYKIETNEVSGDISQVYLVLNSDAALGGPVYIDNVVGEY